MPSWITPTGDLYEGDCRLGDRPATLAEIAEHEKRLTGMEPLSAPLYKVRATLRGLGHFNAIDAFIEASKETNPTLWEAWNMGSDLSTDSLLVQSFAPHFGITADGIRSIIDSANDLKI